MKFALLVLAACGDKGDDTAAVGCLGAECRYDLSLAGTGHDATEGALVSVVLLDVTDGASLESIEQATVTGGSFAFDWPGELRDGSSYRLDWFIDADGSCTCDAPPADGVWSMDLEAVHGDQAIDRPFDEEYDPEACGSFLFDVCGG